MQRLGRVLPTAASEAAPHLGLNVDTDPLAERWRSLVLPQADLLLNLLDIPDRWTGYSYFTVQAGRGAPEAQAVSWFNLDLQPQPIYWLYWLMRDLRGKRLLANCDSKAVNLVAARNRDNVQLVIQNLRPHARTLNVCFDRDVDEQASIDFLEYDPETGAVRHGQRDATITDRTLSIKLAPFGVYAASAPITQPDTPTTTVARTDYYGDRVMRELPHDGEVRVRVKVPAKALTGDTFTLNFGTLGVPDSNNRVRFDHQAPLRIEVNGNRHDVLAGKWNDLTLHRDELGTGGEVEVAFRRRPPTPQEAPRAIDPDKLWTTAASILATTPPTPTTKRRSE